VRSFSPAGHGQSGGIPDSLPGNPDLIKSIISLPGQNLALADVLALLDPGNHHRS